MEVAAFIVALLALVVAACSGWASYQLSHRGNSLPVLVDLFTEHRQAHLTSARAYVNGELPAAATSFDDLPDAKRLLVWELLWYYDNVGALVTHKVIDIAPVSGFIGGSLLTCWERLRPLIEAENQRREYWPRDEPVDDRHPWIPYCENLVAMVEELPPREARRKGRWKLD